MKQYKGYYIDHVVFDSEADIDARVKSDLIKRMQKLNRMAIENVSYALVAVAEAMRCANRLHDEYGMSYVEIEALEIV